MKRGRAQYKERGVKACWTDSAPGSNKHLRLEIDQQTSEEFYALKNAMRELLQP